MNERSAVPKWFVVLRADGVVDSVEGGAPITWVGHPLVDAPELSDVLRDAAIELMSGPPTSNVRRREVRCVHAGRPVEVEALLVEALPLRRAHTRVRELVMRTLDFFATQAKSSNIDLTVDLAENVPVAFVLDGEKIAWALSTLVSNALRHARAHVRVHARWDETRADLILEVADDGPGIAEHQRRWLFERNPATGQSAGLALFMVRDVMSAHRGSVTVQSAPGDGTTFTLKVPRIISR